jgi:hypothetical protein
LGLSDYSNIDVVVDVDVDDVDDVVDVDVDDVVDVVVDGDEF